jgi:hypothetical protein
MSQTGFVAASYANTLPPNIDWSSVFKTADTQQDFLCNLNFVDHDQQQALGYELVQGRFFSREFPSDTGTVILNETAFRQMGWTKLDGTQKLSGFWNVNSEPVERTVIGVIRDFNFESLRATVKPLIMTLGPTPNNEMAIRISPGNPHLYRFQLCHAFSGRGQNGKNHLGLYCIGYQHCLFGALWTGSLHDRATIQGNQYPKGAWRLDGSLGDYSQ